jgi:hypothetical protein
VLFVLAVADAAVPLLAGVGWLVWAVEWSPVAGSSYSPWGFERLSLYVAGVVPLVVAVPYVILALFARRPGRAPAIVLATVAFVQGMPQACLVWSGGIKNLDLFGLLLMVYTALLLATTVVGTLTAAAHPEAPLP